MANGQFPGKAPTLGGFDDSQMRLMQVEAGMEVKLPSLELSNPSTPYSASFERMGKFLGAGGEKTAFEYTDSRGNQLVLAMMNAPKNQRIACAGLPANVAMNARMANYVSRPEDILRMVEGAHAGQRQYGIRDYHYLQMRDRFPGKEAIGELQLAQFNALVTALNGGRYLHPDTFAYARPMEFEGGLVGYINYLAKHVKELNPDLLIGEQVFPNIYLYGVFNEADVMPQPVATRAVAQAREKGREFNPNVARRPWMTMEKYNATLDQIIDEGLDFITAGRNQTERFSRMKQVVGERFPLEAIQQIIVNMNVVHALGFCFGDLKLPNVAFKRNGSGKTLGLIADPGLVGDGKKVLYASEAYLPQGNFEIRGMGGRTEVRHPMSELQIGKLRAARELDNYAMGVIRGAIFEGMSDPYAFDAFLKKYKAMKQQNSQESNY